MKIKLFLISLFILLYIFSGILYSDNIGNPDMTIDVTFISSPYGLTYDWVNDTLWVSSGGYTNKRIYQITIEENPSVLTQFKVAGGPDIVLGLAFSEDNPENLLYFTGNDNKIYTVGIDTGEPYIPDLFRATPDYWDGCQGLAFNQTTPTIYTGDWNADEFGYAQPPDTGSWIIQPLTNNSGFAASYSGSEEPSSLWAVCQDYSNAKLYQYELNSGIPGTRFEHTLPAGYLAYNAGDCAYNGTNDQLFIVDQDGYIYRFDTQGVSIEPNSLGMIKNLFSE
jgi:hypothetical protein